MRRFRDLLMPTDYTTPKDEQDRASKGLAEAVKGSNLRWWGKGGYEPCRRGKILLLAVAPYSQYDLTLLDLIDEHFADEPSRAAVEVYVANVLDYDSVEQLLPDFPGVGKGSPTPLVAVWGDGAGRKVAAGKQAREMAAEALGLAAEDLSGRIRAESPSYRNAGRK